VSEVNVTPQFSARGLEPDTMPDTMSAMTCVFCEVLSGHSRATWVAREAGAAAFLTLPESALAPGHTLVVPTQHSVGVHDATRESLAAVMVLVQKVAVAMGSALGAPGVNLLNASGPGSEQSVDHLHVHVVPRWSDDGFSTWPPGRSSKRLEGEPGAALAGAVAALG
jgi:histidine triad (HIT) family protein